MRGSLVIIAALCVVAAAEASSVRFISVDEGQNGKDKAQRSEVSEGTDPVVQKKVEDAVKKIKDGEEQLEKTVKSLDVERSSTGDKASDSAGEGVKKAASSEKSKVQKRDVRRVLRQLAMNGMKRDNNANILNVRKIVIKYLSLQKTVTSKITAGLILAIDRLESDKKEKEALIAALKAFQKDLEPIYDKTISGLGSKGSYPFPSVQRKFVRADDIPALMNTMNQRNPLAIIPIVGRLINGIAGAASVVDMAHSFAGTRSSMSDDASLMEMIQILLSMAGLPTIPDDM